MSNTLPYFNVNLTNAFPFEVDSLTLTFKNPDVTVPHLTRTWNNVPAGFIVKAQIDVVIPASYEIFCEAVLPDGNSWATNMGYYKRVQEGDLTLDCSVSGSGFAVTVPAFGFDVTTAMYGPNNATALAAVEIENKFPVEAKVKMTHQNWSSSLPWPAQDYTWTTAIAPGGNSGSHYLIVYFNYSGYISGKTEDTWNIEVVLDIPPYDEQPDKAFAPWKNATADLKCALGSDDVNQVLKVTIEGSGWAIATKTRKVADRLTSPNGYNTTAFIQIQNNFGSPINSVTLSHQYSGDAIHDQTRTNIAAAGKTDILMFVEYLTGTTHAGLDYWNIEVVLTDGTAYANKTRNKECYLTLKDTPGVQLFQVSSSQFVIGATSGSATDSMKSLGIRDYNLGRDMTKPYDQNAYLATHNAFANFEDGFWYADQSKGLASQLAMGVSCLLLDIYDYNGDICLIHGTTYLKPFGQPATLQQGLQSVADYLACHPKAVITIIFEDWVTENRNLIVQAFQNVMVGTTSLWDMVYFPGEDVNTSGWPSLQELVDNMTPLVVFSSKANPFPYQWDYMSENVYGDASLDESTWLNSRGHSQELSAFPLCALNHFPGSVLTRAFTWLPEAVGLASSANVLDKALDMFNACKAQYGRLPNFWQVNFFEMPNEEPAQAVARLNQMLHGVTSLEAVTVRRGAILRQAAEAEMGDEVGPGDSTEKGEAVPA